MDAICIADYEKQIKAKSAAEKETKGKPSIVVPKISHFDCYGIWFFGSLCDDIRQICMSKFAADEKGKMHVFIDTPPDKISDGLHDLKVYEHSCKLYKWTAQGYHRGLVVLADDEWGGATAQVYMESQTWSWLLSDEHSRLLKFNSIN